MSRFLKLEIPRYQIGNDVIASRKEIKNPWISDVDQKGQASMELKLGPMTRARMKKLKASNGNEYNGIVAYMEEALKNKFEGQGKASKLFSIFSICKDHSREQFDDENG
ncbi:hypothetical protein M9H77_13254 [Catharanthus roseus]|uniref:Uncharacterized protein n=1 Tax=Catharanthus roseus TaxID=4058 RepID=A0ACC0BJK9_CATRO|nr:hypothetical protein M9H77_13254 [Catharanthus roseus]